MPELFDMHLWGHYGNVYATYEVAPVEETAHLHELAKLANKNGHRSYHFLQQHFSKREGKYDMHSEVQHKHEVLLLVNLQLICMNFKTIFYIE